MDKIWKEVATCENQQKQGRIHGQNQSRTGGQGRECAFSHFAIVFNSSVTDQPTDQRTDRRTDGRTKPLIEMRGRI